MGDDGGLVARGAVMRRQLSDGALAGTVGVVVGVALLAVCLYPVIVWQIKRRRRPKTPHLDAENAPVPHSAGPEVVDLGSHRRLSSSDSFKRDVELSRGAIPAASSNKEWGLAPHHRGTTHDADGHAPPRLMPSMETSATTGDRPRAVAHDPRSLPSPLPFYVGEYMPVSEVREDHSGVFRGNSADYYSPSIPSEAFGMMTGPIDRPCRRSPH